MTHAQRVRLVAAGVEAAYIHDISARTASGATAPEPARPSDRRTHARRTVRRRERGSMLAPWRSIPRELSHST
jgi:hypothetical protein